MFIVPLLIILVIWLFVRLGLPLSCEPDQGQGAGPSTWRRFSAGRSDHSPLRRLTAGSPRPAVSLLEGERYVGSISKPRKKKKTIRRDIVKGRGDPVSGRVRFSPFVLVQEIPLVGKGHKVDN